MHTLLELEDLGWSPFFATHWQELAQPGLVPARVVEEYRGFYRLRSQQGELLAEVTGKVHHEATSRESFPAVGDWVAAEPRPGEARARISSVLPRKTKLARKVAGREFGEQIIATNLDTVFVVTSLNSDFNVKRIERYLALVWKSEAQPVILLNKADLCPDASPYQRELEGIANQVPVHIMTALDLAKLDVVRSYVTRGKTAAFVGSSGVGKSTIINGLAGQSLPTKEVRESDDRGQHTTTSRQMIFVPNGGIVVDTPGMRELQLWDSETGVERTFEDLATLALQCKFRNCGHQGEPGCAVEAAIQNGSLNRERLESYRKLQSELHLQQQKMEPLLAKQEKQRLKTIHKVHRKKTSR